MKELSKIIYKEFRAISTNIPILIVLVLGNIGYGFLYNLLYKTNVYREAPIAVVDMSQSDISRHLTDYIDATQQVKLVAKTQNFHEAETMLIERDIIGFLYIPSDLKTNIMQGQQSECIIYGSTLSFLDYLNISEAVNFAILQVNTELLPKMIESLNMIDVLFLANGKAVNIVSETLYNSSEGYGTYLIPPVMVIIIFQTLMICCAMMSGVENERQRLNSQFIIRKRHAAFKIVTGKAFCFVTIYMIFAIFFLGFLPQVFDLPHLGRFFDIMVMMVPYLFASIFFCLMLSSFFTDSDMPLFIIVFMSVPLVFLTGISYPLELMPWHWKIFHYVIPTAPATMAFVKIDCMGADLSQARPEMITLWIQCVVYYIAAILVWRKKIGKTIYTLSYISNC